MVPLPFVPIYGDEFLPSRPSTMLRSGEYKKNTSILIGVTNDEGAMWEMMLKMNPATKNMLANGTRQEFKEMLEMYLKRGGIGEDLRSDMMRFYFDRAPKTVRGSLNAVNEGLGDMSITCDTQLFAKHVMNDNRVFNYHAAYKMENPMLAAFCGPENKVCHGMDSFALFGLGLTSEIMNFTETDKQEMRYMIKLWSDFAKTDQVPWPAYDVTSQGILLPYSFEVNHQTADPIKKHFNLLNCNLWEDFLMPK
jgi:carboxylesterase type B